MARPCSARATEKGAIEMKYTAPELQVLAVETVNVLLASGGDAGLDLVSKGKITDNGDVVFHAASPAVNIFN